MKRTITERYDGDGKLVERVVVEEADVAEPVTIRDPYPNPYPSPYTPPYTSPNTSPYTSPYPYPYIYLYHTYPDVTTTTFTTNS